ncbi:AMP-binding protein [Thermoanaerobacterium sp. RBIITD]|uniref:AMP-binding protein n=1 Tax=Thermoanaerobacterium sp. RBIITD TaxID=1550240 RepID=UPI000BB95E7C|nr:AMP-binding protein [Thermoanaerobacterium sp. RBIITD]SNX52695.1 fatty-acyl-CoA synthase [Thermoanaerobacterium sp. RBIITD]
MINMTLGQYLDHIASKYPDQDALVVSGKLRYSYKTLKNIANRLAKGLLKIGLKKGDHVAIWASNVPEWIITLFATAKIGCPLVPVNTEYKDSEVEYILKQSDSKAIILIDGYKKLNYVKTIYDLMPNLKRSQKDNFHSEKFPNLNYIINIGKNIYPGMYNFDEILEIGNMQDDNIVYEIQNSLKPDEVIDIQYTSGTTGFPKGAMLTHYGLLNNGDAIATRMKFTTNDKLCITVPLFHCFGYTLSVMACLSKGTTMVLVDHFNPLTVMEVLDKEKCTAVHGVPTMFITMLNHQDFNKFDFSNMRTGIMAGSVCPIKVMKAVVEKMNMREITSVYGLTEASPGITQTSVDDSLEDRVSTVGYVFPEIEMKVVDPKTGDELPIGVEGEIIARGYNIMKGYYKMKEETEKVIEPDGWLHTGDIGKIDERGYLRITGRLKDMIIRGGENISPTEIEECLYHHPGVKDVQIIGVPDEKYGEEIMAYVIPKEGYHLAEDDIIEYAKQKLARFKIPKYVKIISEFPTTTSGKVQKYRLREMAISELNFS